MLFDSPLDRVFIGMTLNLSFESGSTLISKYWLNDFLCLALSCLKVRFAKTLSRVKLYSKLKIESSSEHRFCYRMYDGLLIFSRKINTEIIILLVQVVMFV